MSKDDWFRRRSWTHVDRAEFFARLRRSRGAFHKAQYARIQAYELQIVGTQETFLAAVELLDAILANWSSDAQLAAVHHQYAQCLLGLGQQERAIESFRAVFRAQRQKRGQITDAHLDFGWLCITAPLPAMYAEVLMLLDEFQYRPLFPIHIYRDTAIRAIVHESLGDIPRAQEYARAALSAAARTESPLPRHRSLGVVRTTDHPIHDRLTLIAA
jgi:tetratricopeptide (TPR) repeat protein